MAEKLRVYVAAPFEDRAIVRRKVHRYLDELGAAPTSRWVYVPEGVPNVVTPEVSRAALTSNDEDIERSDVLIVLSRAGVGGEMFAEARYALTLGTPIVWVGRAILSTYRGGVKQEADIDHALVTIRHLAETCVLSGRQPWRSVCWNELERLKDALARQRWLGVEDVR